MRCPQGGCGIQVIDVHREIGNLGYPAELDDRNAEYMTLFLQYHLFSSVLSGWRR